LTHIQFGCILYIINLTANTGVFWHLIPDIATLNWTLSFLNSNKEKVGNPNQVVEIISTLTYTQYSLAICKLPPDLERRSGVFNPGYLCNKLA